MTIFCPGDHKDLAVREGGRGRIVGFRRGCAGQVALAGGGQRVGREGWTEGEEWAVNIEL